MSEALYRSMVADGDDPDAPRRVRVEHRGDRALVTLDEPDRLNVLSAPLVRQLRLALADLVADNDIRAVVLTGADPGFSAGGDLRMMRAAIDNRYRAEGTADVWRWIRREFGGIARLIAGSDTIFVAALNGPAAGVGLAWALTCDLTIASERAVIVPAFARLGLIPEVGTSWALTRRLGYQERWPTTSKASTSTPRPPGGLASCTRWFPTTGCSRRPTTGVRASPRCRRTPSRWRNHCCARRPTPAGTTPSRSRSSRNRPASPLPRSPRASRPCCGSRPGRHVRRAVATR